MKFQITTATQQDLLPLVGLEERVALEKFPNSELGITREDIASIGWGEGRVAKYRQRFFDNPQGNIWVAKDSEAVTGFAAANKLETGHWVQKLYVDPAHQGQDIGSALLQRAEDWLGKDEPIKLGVVNYDPEARAFYEHRGYQEHGIRDDTNNKLPTGIVVHEILMIKNEKGVA